MLQFSKPKTVKKNLLGQSDRYLYSSPFYFPSAHAQEMKKQRERTMALLQQKEAEVEAARNDAVELVASARERTLSRQGSSAHR